MISTYFKRHQNTLNKNYPGITEHYFERLFQDNYSLFLQALSDLHNGVPLEYILNEKFFYKSSYFVDQNVLIPRNETEILVEDALKSISKDFRVLDMGCGSGAIGLSILKGVRHPINLVLSDISLEALAIAKLNYTKNIFQYLPSSEVSFINSDRLEKFPEDSFDLIVSNPPYIKESHDKSLVHANVFKYEPHLALFIPDSEYLEWFKVLFTQVLYCLKAGGDFLMEGHEHHLKDLQTLALKLGFAEAELKCDYTNRTRFLRARKK